MHGPAETVEQFLAVLPPQRRTAAVALRATILATLPAGFQERLQYGMLSYGVPWESGVGMLALVSVANHGPYMAFYFNCVESGGEEALYARWRASGTPCETGSRAVRFGSLDELALDVVAEFVGGASASELKASYTRTLDR
ncbi:DUF1801 domain-containing protein [Conexibacter sp. CPCC 206217]|uniref:DUF1801 domain-containing protein n=1 Tax=Conexibacter sp. CPCC 206217 TaxID=3064574 RepID=UPI0027291C42|nr:DUF1801 domain-containing protein [Conexibacter sp. CPCC 206217]MDO8213338.1 DUF1801 domain-containing protein [Conexibacter sp. CPCC 206217]